MKFPRRDRVLIMSIILGALISSGCAPGFSGLAKVKPEGPVLEKFTAGDGVKIIVYPDSAFLNGSYPIDIDGNIFLPIVGKVNVVSMSPKQLIVFLQNNFQQYLRYPEIQVRPLIRVSLLGGFIKPGLYYAEPENSIWDLIYMAGGTTNEQGLRKLKWERDKKYVDEDLIPFLENGESLVNIGFRSGDQIWTPSEKLTSWTMVRDFLLNDVLPFTSISLSILLTYLSIRHE